MKKIYSILSVLAASALMFTGCFNLDEEAFSEVVQEQFVPSDQDVAALLASTYSEFGAFFDWYGMFDAQEEPCDVIITPVRPNGWDDGGVYQRMHKHTWKANDPGSPASLYSYCFQGINAANRVNDQIVTGALPCGDLEDLVLGELKAVRALWYAILLDSHGNVPIVTSYSNEVPVQASRDSVYNFVVRELNEVLDAEVLSKENSANFYGRINHWGATMALMRVYLNAEVYTGKPAYDKALALAETVINESPYSLAADYSDNFKVDLGPASTEVIFAIPYDNTYTTGNHVFSMGMKWYPPTEGRDHFGWTFGTWGGSCGNPQFINSYQPGDLRKEKTWLHGPMMKKDAPNEIAWTALNYLPSIDGKKGSEAILSVDFGCRQNKYEQDIEAAYGNQWGNDFAWFRLSEAYYTAAECKLRLGQSGAAEYVNAVRARSMESGVSNLTDADLMADTKMQYGLVPWGDVTAEMLAECNPTHDWSAYAAQLEASQTPQPKGKDSEDLQYGGMYDEWGWEFALEGLRRQQMIRFGTFSTRNWYNHEAVTDGHTALFPHDEGTQSTNANIGQNPGYDSANGVMAEEVAVKPKN